MPHLFAELLVAREFCFKKRVQVGPAAIAAVVDDIGVMQPFNLSIQKISGTAPQAVQCDSLKRTPAGIAHWGSFQLLAQFSESP